MPIAGKGVGIGLNQPHPDMFGRLKVGHWYVATTANATNTSALTVGRLYACQYYVPTSCTLDRLGAEVTTAGAAGSVVRLGIYNDTGDGMPGSLLLDAGTINGTSQTVQSITVSQAVNKGVYWFAAVCQVNACTVRSTPLAYNAMANSFLTSAPTAGQTIGSYYYAAQTGALPDPYTTTPTIDSVNTMPRLHFRVA